MTHTLIPIETLKHLIKGAEEHVLFHPNPSLADSRACFEATQLALKLLENPVRPIVVANITGGILQGASADYPVNVYTLDFDSQGDLEFDGSNVFLGEAGALVDLEFVDQVMELVDARD